MVTDRNAEHPEYKVPEDCNYQPRPREKPRYEGQQRHQMQDDQWYQVQPVDSQRLCSLWDFNATKLFRSASLNDGVCIAYVYKIACTHLVFVLTMRFGVFVLTIWSGNSSLHKTPRHQFLGFSPDYGATLVPRRLQPEKKTRGNSLQDRRGVFHEDSLAFP